MKPVTAITAGDTFVDNTFYSYTVRHSHLGLDVQCAVLPRIQPMRLTTIAKAFDDPDYIFELKHDGFRAIAYIEASECKLVSRNLNHFKSFHHLKKSLDKLPVQNAILDGEVVCLDSNGVSQFNELMSRKGKPVFFECIDQLLRFCTAAPMLNSFKRVFLSHSPTSSPLLHWR